MNDADCVRFLQWALPRLRMNWPGFRRVRRQVCKRVTRRIKELGLPDSGAYRALLESDTSEWCRLDALCRITISRFYRDRGVFDFLRDVVLPDLVRLARRRGDPALRCWSAGCASGEEAYTLAALWHLSPGESFAGTGLRVLATDADERLLERAREGRYAASSLRDLPDGWLESGFDAAANRYAVKAVLRSNVEFRREDIRESAPAGTFHLVLCRNLAFTYFEDRLQAEVLRRVASRIVPGGALVIGVHEKLPAGAAGFTRREARPGVYARL